MARILCNVAGGGKPLKGNAETSDVLAGKTFSNKQSNALTGSMPNQGGYTASKSWARGNGTTYIRIPKGAYLTAANNGLDLPEVTVADNLYGQGEYNNNYNRGYTNGWNACRQAAMTNVYVTVKADAQYAGKDAVVSGWGSSSLTESYGKTGSHQEDSGDNRHVSASIISWGGMPDAK